MKKCVAILTVLLFTIAGDSGQISPELQEAINSVPFANFDHPANRDKSKAPEVASPVNCVKFNK